VRCRPWVVAVTLLAPGVAAGQTTETWAFSASVSETLFVGGGSDFLDSGPGLDVSASFSFVPHFRLRADAMLMTLDAQVSSSESADNRVMILGMGPELGVGAAPVSVYVRGLIGIATNLQMRRASSLPERTTSAVALGAGVGLRIALGGSWGLDLGGDIAKVGALDFARTAASGPLVEDPGLLRLRVGARWSLVRPH